MSTLTNDDVADDTKDSPDHEEAQLLARAERRLFLHGMLPEGSDPIPRGYGPWASVRLRRLAQELPSRWRCSSASSSPTGLQTTRRITTEDFAPAGRASPPPESTCSGNAQALAQSA